MWCRHGKDAHPPLAQFEASRHYRAGAFSVFLAVGLRRRPTGRRVASGPSFFADMVTIPTHPRSPSSRHRAIIDPAGSFCKANAVGIGNRRGNQHQRDHQPGRQVMRQAAAIVMPQQANARQPIEEALEMGWPSHGKSNGGWKIKRGRNNKMVTIPTSAARPVRSTYFGGDSV